VLTLYTSPPSPLPRLSTDQNGHDCLRHIVKVHGETRGSDVYRDTFAPRSWRRGLDVPPLSFVTGTTGDLHGRLQVDPTLSQSRKSSSMGSVVLLYAGSPRV
jgi:hypothetical protein